MMELRAPIARCLACRSASRLNPVEKLRTVHRIIFQCETVAEVGKILERSLPSCGAILECQKQEGAYRRIVNELQLLRPQPAMLLEELRRRIYELDIQIKAHDSTCLHPELHRARRAEIELTMKKLAGPT